METEFKNLQVENELIRKDIELRLEKVNPLELKDLWIQINSLIDNEIEQEKYCNN